MSIAGSRVSKHKLALTICVVLVVLAGCSGLLGDKKKDSKKGSATPTTVVPPGLLIQIDKLVGGQCFNAVPDAEQRQTAVLVIGCEQLHRSEVIDRFTYKDESTGKAPPKGWPYPTPKITAMRQAAERLCFAKFEPWMGVPWTSSNFDIESYWPTEHSWNLGDRTIVCTVMQFEGELTTGSARGSKK